jgi:hypothetical protein
MVVLINTDANPNYTENYWKSKTDLRNYFNKLIYISVEKLCGVKVKITYLEND